MLIGQRKFERGPSYVLYLDALIEEDLIRQLRTSSHSFVQRRAQHSRTGMCVTQPKRFSPWMPRAVSGTLFLLHLITITLSRTNLHFTHTVTLDHAPNHMSYACPGLCTDSVGIYIRQVVTNLYFFIFGIVIHHSHWLTLSDWVWVLI